MLRLLLALGAAVILAAPATAGTILYATAASQRRVDGFCINGNGGLDPSPRVQMHTAGDRPRRLKVSPDNKFLFVAQKDRIEIFAIGPRGGLEAVGKVPGTPRKISPHDFGIGFDGRVLYLPDRIFGSIDAFDLSGLYPDDPATPLTVPQNLFSCIQGRNGSGWEDVIVRNDLAQPLLYLANSDNRGTVSTYPLTADGAFVRLCVDPETGEVLRDPVTGKALECGVWGPEGCDDEAQVTPSSSRRKRLSGAGAILLDGNRLYVESRFAKQLSAFDLLEDGTFSDQLPDGNQRQAKAARTRKGNIRYVGLAMAGRTLLLTQFVEGRIDSYRLRSDGTLPPLPTARTREDVRTSPVRLTVHNGVVYVAAGEADRVQAYRLYEEGQTRDEYPFSQTDLLRGSFPNDVAVATTTDSCN